MNQTITTDIDEWQDVRTARYSGQNKYATNVNMIQLPLPESLKVKGYALMPTFMADNEVNMVKAQVLSEDDSLLNYDFSNCYIYDYFMNIGDSIPLKEDHTPDFNQPWKFTSGRMVRYSGEAIKICNQ